MAREKVAYIKIGTSPDANSAWVQTKTGKTYALWWTLAWPEYATAAHHVMHSHWVSLLRDASINNLDVEISTESSTSSKVTNVKLYGV